MKRIIYILTFLLSINYAQAQTTIEEVKQLTDEGKYILALDKIQQLVKQDSTNAQLWHELGELQMLNKRYNDACSSFARSLAIDSSTHSGYLALANAYQRAGRNGAAVRSYKSLLQKDANNVAALSKLAQIYFMNNPDLAYQQYEKLYNIDTLNVGYLFMMAKCLLLDKEAIKAFHLLKKAFRKDTSNVSVAAYLNKMYSDLNIYDTAMLVINTVINQFPEEGRLYFRRGSTQFKKNYHFRSVPDFKRAMELGYKSDVVINRLAKSLFSIKKYTESKRYFDELFQRQDTIDYLACMYVGNIYNELNKPDSALFFFDKALKLVMPDNMLLASLNGGKATSYKLKKDYRNQIKFLKKRRANMKARGFVLYSFLLEIATIYDEKLHDHKSALHYYTEYYERTKNLAFMKDEDKEKLLARINRMKEELHFRGSKR